MTEDILDRALSYKFSIDDFQFSLDVASRLLTGQGGTRQVSGRSMGLLLALLDNPGKPLIDKELDDKQCSNLVRDIRNAFRTTNSDKDSIVYPDDRVQDGKLTQKLWPVHLTKSSKHQSVGTARTIMLNAANVIREMPDGTNSLIDNDREDRMWRYGKRNEHVALADANVNLVIADLLALYPEELEGFFHQLPDGTPCPFHLMNEERYGRPSFPIEVSDEKTGHLLTDRGRDSLKRQRWLERGRLNNGGIYSLHDATPTGWRLGKTGYYDILDSCDWVKSKMFEAWGNAFAESSGGGDASGDAWEEERATRCRQALEACSATDEWLERIKRITRKGDFSTYAAGIAFTMPIVATVSDTPALLLAKGSSLKATGQGKLHCCPAGMLEFYPGTRAKVVAFDDLRTYMTKELFEETLNHPDFVEKDVHDRLMGEFIDFSDNDSPEDEDRARGELFTLAELEELFEQVIAGWTESPKQLAAAHAVRGLSEDSFAAHYVLDAFVLRPEIIVPIFLDEAIHAYTCWEVEGKTAQHMLPRSFEEAWQQLKSDMGRWAAPGFAAALLAFDQHFSARRG